jgi:hypothetical protein
VFAYQVHVIRYKRAGMETEIFHVQPLSFPYTAICSAIECRNHLSLTDISNAGAGRKDTCYTSSHQCDPNARERAPHIHTPALKHHHVRRQITIYYTEDMFGFFSS